VHLNHQLSANNMEVQMYLPRSTKGFPAFDLMDVEADVSTGRESWSS
jgi:hypothetical protein